MIASPVYPSRTPLSKAVFDAAEHALTEQNRSELAQSLLVFDPKLGVKVPFTQRVVITRGGAKTKTPPPAILAALLERNLKKCEAVFGADCA